MATALTIPAPSPFSRVWAFYERSLRRRPVLTQAVSSALLWGLGDVMAQRIESRGRGGVDARRMALTAAFGGAVIGPAGHGWYTLLEKLVQRLGLACSMKSMLLKVTVDNLLYSPCYVLAFFAYGCMAIDGLSPAEFAEKMREEFVPTMLAEAIMWPPYMAAVFSRVPVQHQLLAVNVATVFDVCFLSWMRTRHEEVDADQAVEQQHQREKEKVKEKTQKLEKQRGQHQPVSQQRQQEKQKKKQRAAGQVAAATGSQGGDAAAAGGLFGERLAERLVAAAAAGAAAAVAAVAAAAAAAASLQPEPLHLQPLPPDGNEPQQPSHGARSAAFMAASATCSTGGGGRVRVGGASKAVAAPSASSSARRLW